MCDLRVCAACLATDLRMYSMSASSLLQPYQLLAGVQVNDGMPNKLCWECAALVNKFNLFRHKCKRAYLLLQDIYNQHGEITESGLKLIDRKQNGLISDIDFSDSFYVVIERKAVREKRTNKIIATVAAGVVAATTDELPDDPRIKTELDAMKVETGEVRWESEGDADAYSNADDDDVTLEEIKREKRTYSCSLCSLQYRSASAHRAHVRKVHPDGATAKRKPTKSHVCDTCGATFNYASSLRQHSSVHTGAANYKCKYCPKSFVFRRSCWSHMTTHASTRSYVCHVCGKPFKTLKYLKDHILTHRESRDFKCKHCPKNYTTYKALWLHARKSHSKHRPHVCHICNMGFSLKSELKLHIIKRKNHKARGGLTTRKCAVCDVEFSSRGEFLAHRIACRVTSAAQPAVRPAQAAGSVQSALAPNVEAKTRTYKCKICSRDFAQYWALTLHITTTHSDERPYVCEVCGKGFKVKYGLRRHLLVHTGEKQFKCHMCDKAFTTNNWKQQHVRRVHYNEHIPYKPRERARRRAAKSDAAGRSADSSDDLIPCPDSTS